MLFRSYLGILAEEPRNAEVLHHLGLIHQQEGDRETAERMIREAIAIEPRQRRFHLNLATVLRACGRPEAADEPPRGAAGLAAAARATESLPEDPVIDAIQRLAAKVAATEQRTADMAAPLRKLVEQLTNRVEDMERQVQPAAALRAQRR